jgi:CheY-like chemotaxis protein
LRSPYLIAATPDIMTDETAADDLPVSGSPLVLLIEDHQDSRDLIELVLKAAGFDVVCADGGREGIERLRSLRAGRREAPCVVILDLLMREGSGRAFRIEQMQDPSLADVPVIVISADVFALQDVHRLAPLAVFVKPFNPATLVPVIRRACATATL